MPGFLDNLVSNAKKALDPAKPSGRTTGGGQSLGGSKPGTVHSIEFTEPGPLGMRVDKRQSDGTTIISEIVPDSQASRLNLQIGDVVCFANSNGQADVPYKVFLELAKGNERPLSKFGLYFFSSRSEAKKQLGSFNLLICLPDVSQFISRHVLLLTCIDHAPRFVFSFFSLCIFLELDIRRLPLTSNNASGKPGSVDAQARKQAMIAAAEARNQKHLKQTQQIRKVTKTTLQREQELESIKQKSALQNEQSHAVDSQHAIQAKQQEQQTAQALGYNPYETNKVTAGQARNATVDTKHGAIGGGDAEAPIPEVAAPSDLASPVLSIDNAFDDAYTTAVTSSLSKSDIQASFTILTKLLTNATTKEDVKFQTVKISNPKIQLTVVQREGMLDILLACGFVLTEEEGESLLSYSVAPSWLPQAMEHLKSYGK